MKSKRLLALLGIVILWSAADGWAHPSGAEILFVRDEMPVELSPPEKKRVAPAILATVKATAYDATSYAGSAEQWQRSLKGSYLLLRYPKPAKVVAFWRLEVLADEILIPLSPRNYYLLRNTRSGKYRAFTKWLPGPYADLVCREPLLIPESEGFCEEMVKFGIWKP